MSPDVLQCCGDEAEPRTEIAPKHWHDSEPTKRDTEEKRLSLFCYVRVNFPTVAVALFLFLDK